MAHEVSVISHAPGLGQGVYCDRATIASHGMGLFASHNIKRGSIVTWYDGFVVPKEALWTELLLYQPCSHTFTFDRTDFAVQGLQHPVEGWGAGSFINHRPAELANCEYLIFPASQHRLQYHLPPLDVKIDRFPVCVIIARRDIKANEELFCDYTRDTCAILGIFYDHVDYCQ